MNIEQQNIIGKIAYYREQECQSHPVESVLGKWILEFQEIIEPHCLKKPRYTELRPLKFESLVAEANQFL